jgi:hypothetical protein
LENQHRVRRPAILWWKKWNYPEEHFHRRPSPGRPAACGHHRSPTGDPTFLVTEFGRAFTADGFGNWFRKQCDDAGLPQCSAHGLRKAGATIAAEAGATDRQLMAQYDWESAAQATAYTAAADRKRLSGETARLLASDQSGNEECPTELPHLENTMVFQNDNEGDGGSDSPRTTVVRRDRKLDSRSARPILEPEASAKLRDRRLGGLNGRLCQARSNGLTLL